MVTDMESTYLTKVDVDARLQHILFAHNSQQMCIPEDYSVMWDNSLCKRAIDENCFYSDEVNVRWKDCIAATTLGITTFLSTPIHLPDGSFTVLYVPPVVRKSPGVNALSRSYNCLPV